MREWLARDGESPAASADVETYEEPAVESEASPAHAADDEIDVAIAEARRFRASLADALAMRVDELMRDIASEVLARELELAPCDVARIVERAVQRYGTEPVCIRANPTDANVLRRSDTIVIADDSLRGGDVVLEVRYGSIDATLGVRLERVLGARTQ